MPVYEFLCEGCDRIFSFFARDSGSAQRRPKCPRCGKRRLNRVFSQFATATPGRRPAEAASEAPGGDGVDSMSPDQEARMERAMASLAGDLDSIDENNPRQMASVMRRLSEATGEPIDDPTDEMIHRLEAGEDPEKVEEAMADEFGDEGAPGGGGAPSHDNGLYDL